MARRSSYRKLTVWPTPFTYRQLQVLGGLSVGMRYSDLAAYLGLHPRTVEWIGRQMWRKMGIEGSCRHVEGVAAALRNRWIE